MIAELFVQLGQLLLIVLIGYVGQRKLFSDQVADDLSQIVLWVALPCAMLSSASVELTQDGLLNIGIVCIAASVFYLLSIGVSELLARRMHMPPRRGSVFCCSVTFANTAFIGYPMCQLLVGESGVFYASFFNMIWNVFFFTYGLSRLAGRRENGLKGAFTQDPSLLVMIVMLVVFFLRVRYPAPISGFLDLLGGLCTPLSMLVIGCMLAKMDVKAVWRDRAMYLISALRLLVFPLLMLLCAIPLRNLGVDKDLLLVIIILCAMPAGSLVAVFARRYGADAAYASGAVMHSMLVFVVTIPLVVLLSRYVLG